MSRVPSAGPGQFMSNMQPGLTNQPFVQPASKYSVFDSVLSALPQVAGLVGGIADMDRSGRIADYQEGEALAKAQSASLGSLEPLEGFYADNASNRVPAIRTASTEAWAGVHTQRREAAARLQEDTLKATQEAEATSLNLQLAQINNRVQIDKDVGEARSALGILAENYKHRPDLLDKIISTDTSIVSKGQEYAEAQIAQQEKAYNAAVKNAEDMAKEIVASVVKPLMETNALLADFSKADPATQTQMILGRMGEVYAEIAQTGEDTLGPDRLPTDPILRSAIIKEFNSQRRDLDIKVNNIRGEQINNTNIQGLVHGIVTHGVDPQRLEQVILRGDLSSVHAKGTDGYKRTVDSVITQVSNQIAEQVTSGSMDPVVALETIDNLSKITTKVGIDIGRVNNESREIIANAMTDRLELGLKNSVGQIGPADGMKPEEALAMKVSRVSLRDTGMDSQYATAASIYNLDLLIHKQYVDGRTDLFTANSINAYVAGDIALEGLQPKSEVGVQYLAALSKVRNKMSQGFPKEGAPDKRNPWELVSDGLVPSVEETASATLPTDMVYDSKGLEVLGLWGFDTDRIQRTVVAGSPAEKLNVFSGLAMYGNRLYGAGIPKQHAEGMVDDFLSSDPNRVLQGIAQLRAVGGVNRPEIRDILKYDDKRAALLGKWIVLSRYIKEDGSIDMTTGTEWLSSFMDTPTQLQDGKAKRTFTTLEDVPGFEDLQVDPVLSKTITELANIETSAAYDPSKSEIGKKLMAELATSGIRVNEFEKTLVNDPYGYVTTKKQFEVDWQEAMQFEVGLNGQEMAQLKSIFNLPDNINLPKGATYWDVFAASEQLPEGTKIDDYEFRLNYSDSTLNTAPDGGANSTSLLALFANGGQVEYRLKDPTRVSGRSALLSYSPITGIISYLADITKPEQQWRGAGTLRDGKPLYWNPNIVALPWKELKAEREDRLRKRYQRSSDAQFGGPKF